MLYCHILHKCSYLTLTLAVLLKTKYIDINYGQVFMTDAIKDKEMISTLTTVIFHGSGVIVDDAGR